MPGPDLVTFVRTTLAASTAAADDRLRAYYCAAARVALERLRGELRELDLLVDSHEQDLVRRGAPKEQLAMEPSP